MLAEERRAAILKEVNEANSVTAQELKEILGVSESTIRRDITQLSKEGKLIKVFGGAVSCGSDMPAEEPSVDDKSQLNIEEKRRIAAYASAMVRPGDFVYIDAGTTTGYLIEYLTEQNAVYITNAVSHARDLMKKGFRVFLIGGELKENTEAIIGADAVLNVQKFHFSIGFFGTNGVLPTQGFTTPDIREGLIKQTAVANTRKEGRYILADHDKFGVLAPVTFAQADAATVITDRDPGDMYKRSMQVKIASE